MLEKCKKKNFLNVGVTLTWTKMLCKLVWEFSMSGSVQAEAVCSSIKAAIDDSLALGRD